MNRMACLDPRSERTFSTALYMYEKAAMMSKQASAMYVAAVEAVNASIEIRMSCASINESPSLLTSSYCVSQNHYRAMLTRMLDHAISLTGADMGNIQQFDPSWGALKIEVQRGFDRPFLEFFDSVHCGQAACGTAIRNSCPVTIEDVTLSPIFIDSPSLEVLLDARVRAVQSVPLVSNSGAVLGVLSTHYRKSHSLDYATLRLINSLSRSIADLIEVCTLPRSDSQYLRKPCTTEL